MKKVILAIVVALVLALVLPSVVLAAGNKGELYDYDGNGVYDCLLTVKDGVIRSWHGLYKDGNYTSYIYRSLDGKTVYGRALQTSIGTSYYWYVSPKEWVK